MSPVYEDYPKSDQMSSSPLRLNNPPMLRSHRRIYHVEVLEFLCTSIILSRQSHKTLDLVQNIHTTYLLHPFP